MRLGVVALVSIAGTAHADGIPGTGNDPNAYRVFNPTRQGQRFDPTGAYIRRHVPELADVADEDIHDPSPLVRASTGYPLAILDHREAVARYRLMRAQARSSH